MRGIHRTNFVIVTFFLLELTSCLWWIYKIDLCDLESASRWSKYNPKQLFHKRYLHSKWGDPSSSHSQVMVVTLCLWWIYTKLTSATFKVGQDDLHTIPSSFAMRSTHTPNLMIPGQFVPTHSEPKWWTEGCTHTQDIISIFPYTLRVTGIQMLNVYETIVNKTCLCQKLILSEKNTF